MREAVSRGDAAEMSRAAHALKSSSFNVGAKALAELCHRLEQLGKRNELAQGAELVAEAEALYEGSRRLLAAEMNPERARVADG
jgi:HPt (histidine-containing phosphotransfer) domain-containing protein